MKRRMWQGYHTGSFDYEDEVRRAMPGTAGSVRQVVSRANGQGHNGLAVRNTSHMLVEEIFDLESGGNTYLSFFDPIRLIQHILDNSPRLAQHYGEVVVELDSEGRWRLLLGFDEQTPGSKVNAYNKRKNMVLFMNFIEVGPDCLENSNTWFVPFVSQAHRIKHVRGGWSAVLRRVLHRLLIGPCSLSHGGVLANYVDGEGRQRPARILASLHTCLTDGEGHQVTLQWNGPSSMKPSFDLTCGNAAYKTYY